MLSHLRMREFPVGAAILQLRVTLTDPPNISHHARSDPVTPVQGKNVRSAAIWMVA